MTKQQFLAYFQPNQTGGMRALIPVNSGKVNLSIVCGEYHYSTPRSNQYDATVYSAFELAVFDGDEWASYEKIKSVGIFDIIGEGEHEEEQECNYSVWVYVPLEDLLTVINKC